MHQQIVDDPTFVQTTVKPPTIRHFYVDEAGDLTLFDKRGHVIVGREGCSRCFLVGAAEIQYPEAVHDALERLRSEMLADPYYWGVPSFQLETKKTAVVFHAKDDLPEVRFQVLQLLRTLNVKVLVAFRRKRVLAELAVAQFRATGQRIKIDSLYDDLVSHVFRDVLSAADEYRITFARRGKSDRNEALTAAVQRANRAFQAHAAESTIDWPTSTCSTYPSQAAGLQVVDYYLWALQRLLERGEERFFEVLRPQYQLVMDLDDTRNGNDGEHYTVGNPLHLEKIKPITSG